MRLREDTLKMYSVISQVIPISQIAFAKLSPSPSSSWLSLALFPLDPATHPHPPPPARESLFGSTISTKL
jgi:hypothetical protein